jgi:hypothetical protein
MKYLHSTTSPSPISNITEWISKMGGISFQGGSLGCDTFQMTPDQTPTEDGGIMFLMPFHLLNFLSSTLQHCSKWMDSGEIKPPGLTGHHLVSVMITFYGIRKEYRCTSGVGFARGSLRCCNGQKFHWVLIHSLGFSNEVFTNLMHKSDKHSHWIVTNTLLWIHRSCLHW